MLVHFVSDYFHYDGKFWATLKMLFLKPGKLTKMYFEGKRASYLKPVQLYIFVSAVFFLVFFKIVHLNVIKNGDNVKAKFSIGKPIPENLSDTFFNKQQLDIRESREKLKKGQYTLDSIITALPPGFSKEYVIATIARKLVRYGLSKNLYIGSDIVESIMSTIFHSIPKLFFILMPVLAFLLKLFFRKKEYVYIDHAVMSLHLHSAMFISFMTGCMLSLIEWDRNIIDIIFFMVIPVLYFFLAFRNFYHTNWFKTFYKGVFTIGFYLFIVLLSAIVNLFLLVWFG
jgi:hypothetical protein